MQIWLDTTNILSINKAIRLGLLSGVTTNPSIIADSKRSFESVLGDLLHHQNGPVTAQVDADDVMEMVEQGRKLYSYSTRLIIKIPATKQGIEAIHLLSRQGIPTMATAIYEPHQALLAALTGADYVAPYLSRIEKAGRDPWLVLKAMSTILQNYKLKTKILAASLQNLDYVNKCAEAGIYAITLKDELFEQLIATHPLTQEMVNFFDSKKPAYVS